MIPIASHITAFLRERLPVEKMASPNTCDTYAYAFQLLFEFASKKLKVAPSDLCLEQLDAPLILAFLAHLENGRGCCPSSQNARLTAIKSFFRYVQYRVPRKRDAHESVFLDLPTHQRREIWSENEGADMAAIFARGIALGVIQDFGLNFLFERKATSACGRERSCHTAQDRLQPGIRPRLSGEHPRGRGLEVREHGSNAGYAKFLIEAISRAYPNTVGADPYTQMFATERRSLEEYLKSLGVPGLMTLPEVGRQ